MPAAQAGLPGVGSEPPPRRRHWQPGATKPEAARGGAHWTGHWHRDHDWPPELLGLPQSGAGPPRRLVTQARPYGSAKARDSEPGLSPSHRPTPAGSVSGPGSTFPIEYVKLSGTITGSGLPVRFGPGRNSRSSAMTSGSTCLNAARRRRPDPARDLTRTPGPGRSGSNHGGHSGGPGPGAVAVASLLRLH